MKFLSRTVFPLLFLALSACSVYQSDGRKFLEKQAFSYTGAQAYLISCPGNSGPQDLELAYSNAQAQVFRLSDSAHVRVLALNEPPYACDYGFTSTAEMDQQLDSAIELTIRLGEFANRHIYPLK